MLRGRRFGGSSPPGRGPVIAHRALKRRQAELEGAKAVAEPLADKWIVNVAAVEVKDYRPSNGEASTLQRSEYGPRPYPRTAYQSLHMMLHVVGELSAKNATVNKHVKEASDMRKQT